MNVFVAVAEMEGFAAAARRLNMSPPAVTRAVSALEDRLGVRLLTRTTRVVRVTEAGARYLEDARRIMADFDEADAAAAGAVGMPTEVKPEPVETDFAAALKMLALLPLSNEERAEAVRRLLKGCGGAGG